MKVLIIDDNKSDRMLLKKILNYHDFETAEADNGAVAWRFIRDNPKPDLIISDILMPVMDGYRFLRKIKRDASLSDIPVIIYTAHYISEKDKKLALKLGASRAVVKPKTPSELLSIINKVLNEKAAGKLEPRPVLIGSEQEYLREYSQRVVKKLEEKIAEQESLYLQIIRALASIVEVADPDFTYSHLERVPVVAKRLGERLELNSQQLKALEIAAYLHDIGKIAIPQTISKRKKLDADDWRLIKRHPDVAYNILKHVNWPWPLLEIVRHHHEHYDGSGYPDGLKGEAIPITARIFAVVDAWDSMRHDQYYRPKMTVPEALAELRRCKGTMFDPAIVDEFIAMVNEAGQEEAGRRKAG